MTFTREELAAYEAKPAPTAASAAAEPVEIAEPAGEETPATDPESGTTQDQTADTSTAAETAPADPDDDGSTPDIEDSGTSPATAEGETDPDPEAEAAPPAPKKGSAAARIQELIDENKALRGFGNHVTGQLTEALAKLNGGKGATQAQVEAVAEAPPADDPMPTLEASDYDSAAHTKKLSEWTQRQIKRGVQEAVQTVRQQQDNEVIKNTYLNKAAEFAKTKADYEAVMSNPNLPQQKQRVSRAVVLSDIGPQIAYHLAKHPDLATRISKMDVESALQAIGRIEGQLTATTPPPKKGPPPKEGLKTPAPKTGTRTVSKAPPPPRTINTGSNTQSGDSLDTSSSMDDWVARERSRKMQERENRRKMRTALR